ncbi:hypothetical protein D3C76_1449050 [compost metagenome]
MDQPFLASGFHTDSGVLANGQVFAYASRIGNHYPYTVREAQTRTDFRRQHDIDAMGTH